MSLPTLEKHQMGHSPWPQGQQESLRLPPVHPEACDLWDGIENPENTAQTGTRVIKKKEQIVGVQDRSPPAS